MARNQDFVFTFMASNAFSLTVTNPAVSRVPIGPYQRALELRKAEGPRTLTIVESGSESDLTKPVAKAMEFVRDRTNGKLDTIGAFCIVASSNGCSMALAFGAALKKAGAPRLSYIGVADVTFFPFGRDPAVPGAGALQPRNAPLIFGGIDAGASDIVLSALKVHYPRTGRLSVPEVVLNEDVDAERRRNFFQTEGNHAKLVKKTPLGMPFDWWWFSSMKFGEVHGELVGWDNKRFDADGLFDDENHNDLCSVSPAKPTGILLTEAGAALARFPRP